MTEQTIEIEGLPEGWKSVAYRRPYPQEYILKSEGAMEVRIRGEQPWLIIEKIQPRRIVLEETNEERRICFGEWYESQEGKLMRWPYGGKTDGKHRVWREVKETDIPLNNNDLKLSLSVDDAKEIYTYNILINQKIIKFIKENS